MKHLIITSLLVLSSFVGRANNPLILAKVEDESHLHSLFENPHLNIHYYNDRFIIASLEEGKTIAAETVVLDKASFSDVDSYAIVYCYDDEKEAYLNRIAGNNAVLYSGEHFLIMKKMTEGFMPAKNDGMIIISQTTASLPQKSFDFPVVTEIDPIIQSMIEMVNTETLTATVQSLQDFGTRFCTHQTSVLAQNWIKTQYETLNLDEVYIHQFTHNPWWGGTNVSHNVIAVQRGTVFPDEFIVCGGHYDSFSYNSSTYEMYYDNAPGADDNATGSAGILETARILSQYEFQRSIIYCAFSAEECGLNGSDYFALKCKNEGMNIVGYFNIDMSGYLQPGTSMHIDLIHPTSATPLANYYKNVANVYSPELPVTPYAGIPGGDSDHTSFNKYGFMGIFPFEDRNNHSPYIHSPNDVIGTSVNTWEQVTVFTKLNIASIATLAEIVLETPLPVANFTVSETTIEEGNSVQFTDLSLNDPTKWHWYFEGGTPSESTAQHPKVLYETHGKFDVKLVVSNENGSDSLTRQEYITVTMLPPIADFTADVTEIEEDGKVSFTNLSQQNPQSYKWYFEGGTPSESTQENPVITYSKAGIYPVRLVAKNEGGENTAVKEDYITVTAKTAIGQLQVTDYEIQVYPNPATGELRIMNNEQLTINNVEIFDVLGRLVFTSPNPSEGGELATSPLERAGVRLNVSDLPAGVYFVRITTEKGVVMKKITKK